MEKFTYIKIYKGLHDMMGIKTVNLTLEKNSSHITSVNVNEKLTESLKNFNNEIKQIKKLIKKDENILGGKLIINSNDGSEISKYAFLGDNTLLCLDDSKNIFYDKSRKYKSLINKAYDIKHKKEQNFSKYVGIDRRLFVDQLNNNAQEITNLINEYENIVSNITKHPTKREYYNLKNKLVHIKELLYPEIKFKKYKLKNK